MLVYNLYPTPVPTTSAEWAQTLPRLPASAGPAHIIAVASVTASSTNPAVALANSLAGRPVFRPTDSPPTEPVILIHPLPAAGVVIALLLACPAPKTMLDNKHVELESAEALANASRAHVRSLLFLTHVAHTVIFVSPRPRVDMPLMRLLRLLQHAKDTANASILSYLSTTLPPELQYAFIGRRVPIVLFAFPFVLQDQSQRKTLIRSLDTRLRTLLRALGLYPLPGLGRVPLFQLPAQDSSVFTMSPPQVDVGRSLLETEFWDDSPDAAEAAAAATAAAGNPDKASGTLSSIPERVVRSILDLAPADSQMPLHQWVIACNILADLFVHKRGAGRARSDVLDKVDALAEVDLPFSAQSCQTALGVARDVYQRALPAVYSLKTHQEHLDKALRSLRLLACGPAIHDFERKLEHDCERHFNSVRLCDSVSMTNRPCRERAPCPACTSHHKALHASNCGRFQEWRPDPFSLQEANHTFYHAIDQRKLHQQLPKMAFLSAQSLRDLPAQTAWYPEFASWSLVRLGPASWYQPKHGIQQPGVVAGHAQLIAVELAHAGAHPVPEPPAGGGSIALAAALEQIRTVSVAQETVRIHVGYEYETVEGARFIASADTLGISGANRRKRRGGGGGGGGGDAGRPRARQALALSTQVPLFLNFQGKMAQLQRIFVVTPVKCVHLPRLRPRVEFTTGKGARHLFDLGVDVVLPSDSAMCLRLPYVYLVEDGPLVQQTPSSPYKCAARLL